MTIKINMGLLLTGLSSKTIWVTTMLALQHPIVHSAIMGPCGILGALGIETETISMHDQYTTTETHKPPALCLHRFYVYERYFGRTQSRDVPIHHDYQIKQHLYDYHGTLDGAKNDNGLALPLQSSASIALPSDAWYLLSHRPNQRDNLLTNAFM